MSAIHPHPGGIITDREPKFRKLEKLFFSAARGASLRPVGPGLANKKAGKSRPFSDELEKTA
jgi:hypothetical protein